MNAARKPVSADSKLECFTAACGFSEYWDIGLGICSPNLHATKPLQVKPGQTSDATLYSNFLLFAYGCFLGLRALPSTRHRFPNPANGPFRRSWFDCYALLSARNS